MFIEFYEDSTIEPVKTPAAAGRNAAGLDAAAKNTAAGSRKMPSYAGGKAGAGVYQQIINLMPPHGTYFEAFLGAGAIMRFKRPAAFNVGIEIDRSTCQLWNRCDIPNFELHRGDAVAYLRDLAAELREAQKVRPEFGRDYLVYADPPYLMEVRSDKKPIYRHEFGSEDQHRDLLAVLCDLPCLVMLSGYENDLYNRELHNWHKTSFTGVSRGGPRTETVWMNFPAPTELHDYRYLGRNKRERENIKRQKQRWITKLEKMPDQKRYALLSAIEDYKRSAAGNSAGEISE